MNRKKYILARLVFVFVLAVVGATAQNAANPMKPQAPPKLGIHGQRASMPPRAAAARI